MDTDSAAQRRGTLASVGRFLDPGRYDFARWVLTLLAAILATGYVLVAIGRARTLLLPATARPDHA